MLVTSLLGFFFLMFGIDIDSGDEVPEVEAIVGSTVLLNCSFPVKASMSISLQVLDWLFNKTTVVHRHEKGADVHVHQDGRFRGRTEVFVKELPSGNFSLLLRNVDLDDAGLYTCQAYMSTGYWTEHSLLQILRGPEAKSPKTTNMITSQTTDLTVNERVFLVLALLLILTVFIAIMMYGGSEGGISEKCYGRHCTSSAYQYADPKTVYEITHFRKQLQEMFNKLRERLTRG